MANNYGYKLDLSPNSGVHVGADQSKVPRKQAGRRTEGNKDEGVNLEDGIKSKTKSRKEVHQRKRERSPPRVDKFRPKKVFTPGSNFMECTSEDEEEMEKAMEQITEKTQIDENAEERDANTGFIADSSIELDFIDSETELGDLL